MNASLARLFLFVLLLAGIGCRRQPDQTSGPAPEPEPEPAVSLPEGPGLRVLFLGNSLTAGNDLPALVQAMARAGGQTLHVHAHTPGGVSLEDHWQQGHSRRLLA